MYQSFSQCILESFSGSDSAQKTGCCGAAHVIAGEEFGGGGVRNKEYGAQILTQIFEQPVTYKQKWDKNHWVSLV